ncbi:MAG: phosphoribosylformylglycinamidine synthase subunit PurS [Candidatus Omnitrophota bacterium]
MIWHIELRDKPGVFDAVGSGIEKDIRDLGISSVEKVRFAQVYILEGDISQEKVRLISEQLLVDKVAQDYSLKPLTYNPQEYHTIEVAYNLGVMDPVEESALKGIRDLRIDGIKSIRTAKKYILKGRLTDTQLKTISEKLLYNKLIQHIAEPHVRCRTSGAVDIGYQFNLITVDLLEASDGKLNKISKDGQLFLNLAEMRSIKDYFKKLKRNPTDCELETIAQTWSEHCGHTTFKGLIDYT